MVESEKPKRRGRPPAPPGEARRHRIVTFVNDDEFAKLSHMCEHLDTSLSTTVYQLLCESLTSHSDQADQ